MIFVSSIYPISLLFLRVKPINNAGGLQLGIVFAPKGVRGNRTYPPEASQMKETNETTACRITITLDSAELPVDQQARNALLTEFRSRVGHLVEGLRGIDADQGDVDVSTGYRYAQVPATCPLCSERLDLQSVHLNNENGAYASAKCSDEDCEWSGDAVYRIIDLEGGESNAIESSVLTGDITPSYDPY